MEVKCPECLTIKTIDKTDKNIQVRCSKTEGGCGAKYYIKKNIVLKKQDKQDNNKTQTTKYKTVIETPLKKTAEINLKVILKCMDRAISSIRNKPQVKQKKGGYYYDFIAWTEQQDILQKLEFEEEK